MRDNGLTENLAREYMRLQQTVEDFDGKALTIKAWSVTLSAAGIVTSYAQVKPAILLVSSGSAFFFWIVEALWKTNQLAHYGRIRDIEKFFQTPDDFTVPYQIAASWSKEWHLHGRDKRVFKVMWWSHVFLPHVIVALSAALLFLFAPPTS